MVQKSSDRAKGRERPRGIDTREVIIPPLGLDGTLSVPHGASALVTFVARERLEPLQPAQ